MPSETPQARQIRLVWAQANDGAIGRDNTIPWRVPEDTARFKALTVGHPVIMGRKTWDSLPPRFRPLPGRTNIVVTRNDDWSDDGAQVAGSLDAALELADDAPIVSIIGGAQIYSAAMDIATELCITEVDVAVDGADVFAPAVDANTWASVAADWQTSSTGTRYRFVDYRRR